jgi:isoprenylcysteine carboxyl methyltransferase (ICMT) family protein YpbQ
MKTAVHVLIFFITWMWCAFVETWMFKETGYSNLGIIMLLSIVSAFAIPYYIQKQGEELSTKHD